VRRQPSALARVRAPRRLQAQQYGGPMAAPTSKWSHQMIPNCLLRNGILSAQVYTS